MDKRTIRNLIIGYIVAVLPLAAMFLMAFQSGTMMFQAEADRHPMPLVLLMLASAIGLFVIFLLIGIGAYVHADAGRRGMPPVPWTLIAVFVPYFIGLIVYLIARKPLQATCASCGGVVREDAIFCPHCGKPINRRCDKCQIQVDNGYKFCPKCGQAVDS
jgi:predicted RNA-binding Zn-ribbon protein involved in translation (DUF1610 family)